MSFSSSESRRDFFSGPAMTRSTDFFQLFHVDDALALAGRQQRRLVDQVGQIGAGEARGLRGQGVERDARGQRFALGVHGQDGLAALAVRTVHDDLPVEAAGAQQRRVEDVGPVGGRHDDDALVGLEAVHLHEQLVEGLLALVVTAAHAGAAMAADGVDLVDEDDAGLVLLGLLEEVAHAAGADAHEHLDEVGTGDAEERHAGLTGHGPRQAGSCRCREGRTEARLWGCGRPEPGSAWGSRGSP